MKEALGAAELDFDNAKVAYFRRAEYKRQEVTYDVLKTFAEAYIEAHHAYQKALYGRVRARLSVARLIRE